MSQPSPTVVTALEKQATHELAASLQYLALAIWCDVNHYSGFARLFRRQSAEEHEHALKLIRHLADRDTMPAIGALAAPRSDFDSLVETAQVAFDLERANTRGIHECYAAAVAAGDVPAQVMLQWFVSEQVEEEAWTDDLLAKTQRAQCSGAIFFFDRHVEKSVLDDPDPLGVGESE